MKLIVLRSSSLSAQDWRRQYWQRATAGVDPRRRRELFRGGLAAFAALGVMVGSLFLLDEPQPGDGPSVAPPSAAVEGAQPPLGPVIEAPD